FLMTDQRAADGESVRTSFEAYDSLGTPLSIDVTMVLESRSSTGTSWTYYAESGDNENAGRFLGSGNIDFNTFGELSTLTPPTIGISRAGTGAVDPMAVTLDFISQSNFTSLSSQSSEFNAVSQDGTPVGVLDSFNVEQTGVITGSFTNGLTRSLGQVAVATFANAEGLVDGGGNTFQAGANSGLAVNVAPLSSGAGRVISGALEQSNVDLSKEFVDLITTSTGYSASSRVITTSDQLIQQLLAMAR
ncbi:MAG: flagellar hook-basal body complex protein, partial [Phycisphaeraceae bacterium]